MPERPSNPAGTRIRRWWTEEEDEVLCREADYQLAQGSLRDWNRIAAKLPGRTNKDCRKRWSKVCKDVRKGAWSQAEDQRLQSAVQQNGYRWTHVAESVGTRHADQCAKRWQHFLDPNLDHSEWLPDDDERLITAVEKHGRKWKIIGEKEFPGRSATDLKNRHVILERKRSQSNASNASQAASVASSTAASNVPDMTRDSSSSSNNSQVGGNGSENDFRDESRSIDSHEFNFNLYSGSVSPTTQTPSGMHTPAFYNGADGTIDPMLPQKDFSGHHLPLIPDLDDPHHLFTNAQDSYLAMSPSHHHQHHHLHHHQQQQQQQQLSHNPHGFPLDGPMDLEWVTPGATQSHMNDAAAAAQAQAQQHQAAHMQIPAQIVGGVLKQEFEGGMVTTPTEATLGSDPEAFAQLCESIDPRSTLILEDVQPDMVNNIMNVLFTSKSKVRMKLFSQE